MSAVRTAGRIFTIALACSLALFVGWWWIQSAIHSEPEPGQQVPASWHPEQSVVRATVSPTDAAQGIAVARSPQILAGVSGCILDAVTRLPLRATIAAGSATLATAADGRLRASIPVPVGTSLVVSAPGYVAVTVPAAPSLGIIELEPEHQCIVRFQAADASALAGIGVVCAVNPSQKLRSDARGEVSLKVMAPYLAVASDDNGYVEQFEVAPGIAIVKTVHRSSAWVGFRDGRTKQPMPVTCVEITSCGAVDRPALQDLCVPSTGWRLPSGSYRIEVDPAFEVAVEHQDPSRTSLPRAYNVAYVDLEGGAEAWIELMPVRAVRIRVSHAGDLAGLVASSFEVLEDRIPELAGWVPIEPAPTTRRTGDILSVFGVDKDRPRLQENSRLRLHLEGFRDFVLDRPHQYLGGAPVDARLTASDTLRLRVCHPDGAAADGPLVVREVPAGSSEVSPGRIVFDGSVHNGMVSVRWGGGKLRVLRSRHPSAQIVARVAETAPHLGPDGILEATAVVSAGGTLVVHGDVGIVACMDAQGMERPGERRGDSWTFSGLESGWYVLCDLGAGRYRPPGHRVMVEGGKIAEVHLTAKPTVFLRGRCAVVGHGEARSPLYVGAFDGPEDAVISASKVRDLRPLGVDGAFGMPDVGPETHLIFFSRTDSGVLVPLDACRPREHCVIETAALRVVADGLPSPRGFLILEGPMRQSRLRSSGVRIDLGRTRETLLRDVPSTNLRVAVHAGDSRREYQLDTVAGSVFEIDAGK